MRADFTTSSRNNPCPICDKTNGNCRNFVKFPSLWLCMSVTGTNKGKTINGYKCLGDNKNGLWSKFVLSDSLPNSDSQHLRQAQKQKRQREKVELSRGNLAAADRDEPIRRVHRHLGLGQKHKQNLLDRGLSESQIQSLPYFSFYPGREVPPFTPANLPGVSRGRLTVKEPGFACPIPDVDGQIIGWQNRFDNTENGKYKWPVGERSSHLPNGELPIGVYRPDNGITQNAIGHAEGFLKSHIIAQKWELPVIGAASANFAASPEQWRVSLERLSAELDTKLIYWFADAGSVLNWHVVNQYQKSWEKLKEWGYSVQIAWYGQTDKSVGDADEISEELRDSAVFISIEKYLEIAKPQSQAKAITPKAHPKQVIELPEGEEWEFWHQARKFTADVIFEKKRFEYEIPKLGSLLAVLSGLGTGKTHYLINNVLKSYAHLGAISIGHRNSLLIQFCEEADGWYHFQNEIKDTEYKGLIKDSSSKIACCADSLVHFEPEDFNGKLLIIDETESVISHLLLSDTSVGIYREKVKQRLAEALDRAALVICLDGHLTDATISYLQSLMKNPKNLIKVQNTYKGNRGKVCYYRGAKAGDKFKARNYNDFINKALNNPNKFVFASDSKDKLEAIEKKLIEGGRSTFRFDSTTNYEDKKKFLQNPVAYLIENKIEVLLYSPSGDAGLNIDIQGYFTDLYFLFMGVLTTSSQLQMLGRIRDPNALIHIYCTPEGLPGNTIGKEVMPEKIQEFQKEYVFECAKATLSGASIDDIALELAQKLIAASRDVSYQQECFLKGLEQHERKNLRQCLRLAIEESGYSVDEVWTTANSSCEELKIKQQEIIIERSEKIFSLPTLPPEEVEKKSREPNITLDDKLAITKTRLLSRLPGIENATYIQPIEPNHTENKNINENSTDAELPIQNEQSNQIDSQPIDQTEPLQTQADDSDKTVEYIEKAVFSSEFIKKIKFDNPQYISQLEMYWLVTHPEIAKRLQQGKWYKKLSFFTDPENPEYAKKLDISGWRSQWLKIHKLLEMGFGYFLSDGAEWSNESQQAKAFYNSAKNPKTERLTGIRVGESSPCELIGRILKSLGHKTESQQVGKGKDKVRIYRISQACINDPIQQAVLTSIAKRYTDLLAEKEILNWDALTESAKNLEKTTSQNAETVILQGLEVEHLPSRCSIENQNEGVLTESAKNLEKTTSQNAETVILQGLEVEHLPSRCSIENQNEGVAAVVNESELSLLVESLSRVDSQKQFAASIAGHSLEVIEDAIALQDSPVLRKQLGVWLDAEKGSVQPKEHSWEQLPTVGAILRWVSGATEKLVLRAIDSDGFCQVKSLLSGLFTNTHISQLQP